MIGVLDKMVVAIEIESWLELLSASAISRREAKGQFGLD